MVTEQGPAPLLLSWLKPRCQSRHPRGSTDTPCDERHAPSL
ncbi:hypothetical protein [Azospirillum largimobile]